MKSNLLRTAFSFILLLVLTTTPPAYSTVHERCPFIQGQAMLSTVGCNVHSRLDVPDSQTVELNLGTYSRRAASSLFSQFLRDIRSFNVSLTSQLNVWNYANPTLPRGTYDLNPTQGNTSALTNGHATHRHRVLRELRWWMTSVESGLQLVNNAGQLGVSNGFDLACNASRLSTNLNHLLSIFSVNTDTLPQQASCRQTVAVSRNATLGDCRSVTSIILRDTVNTLARIIDVMEDCRVRAHASGRHRVRLQCSQHSSLFHEENPIGEDVYFYNFSDFFAILR